MHRIRVKSRAVKRRILRECDVPSLFAFYHDRKWRKEAGEELNERYEQLLGKFTEDVNGFREMMRRTNCVISGSAALWFLLSSPEDWSPNDLDLLAPESKFVDVVKFLTGLDGAEFQVATDAPEWPYHSEAYSARTTITTPKGTLDVFKSCRESALFPIPYYWSTHLMNALTADALYCAYPALTLAGQGVHPAHAGAGHSLKSDDSHCDQGFTTYQDVSEMWEVAESSTCLGMIACSRRQRFFGDDRTFVVPLGEGTVKSSVGWMAELGTAAWRLGGAGCGNERCLRGAPFSTGLVLFDP